MKVLTHSCIFAAGSIFDLQWYGMYLFYRIHRSVSLLSTYLDLEELGLLGASVLDEAFREPAAKTI